MLLDLTLGRLDAVLGEAVQLDAGFLETPAGQGFAFFGSDHFDPAIQGNGAAIGVRKADTELSDRLSAAIAAIRGDGTYQAIAANATSTSTSTAAESPTQALTPPPAARKLARAEKRQGDFHMSAQAWRAPRRPRPVAAGPALALNVCVEGAYPPFSEVAPDGKRRRFRHRHRQGALQADGRDLRDW